MNKKKLSVVMAGAMLATSVAPVLAAETTAKEYTTSQKKLLESDLKALMESELVSTNGLLKNGNRFVTSDVSNEMVANRSVYGIAVVAKDGTEGSVSYDTAALSTTITNLNVGETIKVYKRKTSDFNGAVIPGSAITVVDGTVEKYKATELGDGSDINSTLDDEIKVASNKLVNKTVYDGKNDTIKITLNALDENNEAKVVTIKANDEKLDFQLPLDANNNVIDTTKIEEIQKFDHFAKKVVSYSPSIKTAEKSEYASYKLVADKTENEVLNASELYDGLALTARGTEILADIKNAADRAGVEIDTPGTPGTDDTFALVQLDTTGSDTANSTTGYYSFTVKYYKAKETNPTNTYKTITVRSTSKNELKSLIDLMKEGKFRVGIVAGQNRYETAVNVAKSADTKLATTATATATETANIILVNGEALVDGLAAAPLAASINGDNMAAAPVLLTESDRLNSTTKEYLKELSTELSAKQLKNIKVTLVGGRSVLSNSVVEELEDMGFKVERVGGSNREETSVNVAKAVGKAKSTSGNKNSVFVVGANGEADAMSIAAVASIEDNETPIIVSKAGGISSDALEYIEDVSADGTVRIIGGETVFSKDDEEKISDVLVKNNEVYRIAGANRQATNAAIIKEYYSVATTKSKGIVLVKDGAGNNSELIDALSAANYAAAKKAPIVLATNSVSDAQKNALLNMDKDTNFNAASNPTGVIAQVGQGVARTTLESVAKLLGVSNVK